MATVETHVEVPANETVYDGFISYSHAADDLLAPRLQAGLQRFAKPWWKRRALRIFRDEASLAANPHLWSSITDALDGSGWFVLLLSPEAADSEWVNKEIDYWLEHKDSNRVIPVVTDGDFEWHSDDIAGDATPPALYGVFADEPRWVDLRFARSEEQLDLNNASFRAAVADIASAIRGIPKDELESEEVRQHRRTRRTAIAAGVALIALTLAATSAAVIAVDRGNEANEQRLAAEESAAEADAQRQVAEAETARAENEQARAEQLEFEARTDALAARAIAQLDVDPDLALLLATEALSRDVDAATLSATHTALQRNRTVFLVAAEPGRFTPTAGAVGGLSPDASSVVVAGQGRELALWEVGGVEPVWSVEFPIETTEILDARFSEDGTAIVALVGGQVSENPALDPAQLVVFEAATGAEIATVPDVGCRHFQIDPSPLGPYVDLDRPIPWMRPNVQCEGPLKHPGLIDPLTGSFTAVADLPGQFGRHRFGVPTIDDEGRHFAYGSDGPGQVINLETGDVLFTFDDGNATLSADGNLLLARGSALGRPLELWDLSTGSLLWTFDEAFTRAWFSDDGSMVYGTNPAGTITVLDTATGDERFRFGGHVGPPLGAVMSHDGRRLASFGTDFTARVWDLGSTQSEGVAYQTNSQPRVHVGASADLAGDVLSVWGGDLQQEDALWEIAVIELETGEPLATVTGGLPALSPDGTRLAYRAVDEVLVSTADLKTAGEPGVRPRLGPIEVLDIASGEVVLEIELDCQQYLVPNSVAYGTGCPVVGGGKEWDLEFSPDGRWLGLADSYDRIVTVWDAATGEAIARTNNRGGVPRAVAFSPDSSQVAFHFESSQQGSGREVEAIIVLKDVDGTQDVDQLVADVADPGAILYPGDVSFTEMIFTPDGSQVIAAASNGDIVFIEVDEWELLSPIAAHGGRALDVSVNEAGTLVASAGDDGFVRVWSFEDRSLVTEIDFEVDEIANVEFIDDTHLFVTPGYGNEAVVITLDPDELLEFARSRIFRSFTAEECVLYSIDPCP